MSLYTSRFYVDKVDEELLASCEPLRAIFAHGKAQRHKIVYLDSVNGLLPVNWFELGRAMFTSTNLIVHLSVEEHAHNTADSNTENNIIVKNDSTVIAKAKKVVATDALVASPQVKVKRKYTKCELQT